MLSAVILTFNEEKRIADCIRSVKDVADEVWVIDSRSTDNTVTIAENEGAKVCSIEWKGWVHARNSAVELVSFDFILFVDADERLSNELVNSIKLEKSLHFPHQVYLLNRLNHIGTQAIVHGAWFPDYKLRMYHKSRVSWRGGKVHEWADAGTVKPFLLNGYLLHYGYQSIEEVKLKTKKYASLASQSLHHKPKFILTLKMLFSPPVRFVRDYIIKSGFRDGRVGFNIALESGREVFLKYSKALFVKTA
ncbi:MAG: glycosyltransferase family 2 protein [Bacteroidia bacterium]|nr:glycosyltransferase family 2 protein [Bacteroidia bacterium]